MSGIIENCKHLNTKIWEPHLAGARKCLSCDMVYNPNIGGWHVEEPSIETQLSNLKSKHERVLEMLMIAESALIRIKDHTLHPQVPSVWNDYLQDLVDKPLQEIERLKTLCLQK